MKRFIQAVVALSLMAVFAILSLANVEEFRKNALEEYARCRRAALDEFRNVHGNHERYFRDMERCRVAWEKAKDIIRDEIASKVPKKNA